ncbi:unnamed protein product [Lymnaea stagnalis]|uniref:Uncharacterized protein n=1 Tax=Lymnaea stagnalis TaxID=6523 RepID=A0AAV2HF40_LYMST
MCMEFSVVEDDPFFNFQLSRLNSGDVQDGRLRSVVRYRPVDIHVDCDWLDSPAIPEFLYRR